MTNTTTLDGPADARATSEATSRGVCALVLTWSAAEPARVGEVLLPPPKTTGCVFGRGDDPTNGPEVRVFLQRQRPSGVDATGPLRDPFVSRAHLRLRSQEDRVVLENLAKRAVLVDGRAAQGTVEIGPGQTVEIESRLLFLCAERPATMRSLRHAREDACPRFGEADKHGFVGESPSAWALRDQIALVGACDEHTLLLGQSGTGKELVAQAIHALSHRRGKKLVARNAATLPSGIIDAELFGNVANYPNAGMPERPGLVGEADGGSLFLDEIGELPSALQSHLLRVLDTKGEYQRLGDARSRVADFRLIGATNRSPEDLKHDLVARLTLRLDMPGLNDRREDIMLLARHLLSRKAMKQAHVGERFFDGWDGRRGEPRISVALARGLVVHDYGTHVRELDKLLWRSIVTSAGDALDLTEEVRAELLLPEPKVDASPRDYTAEEIRDALQRHGGVKDRVWRELGMSSRHVLHRMMKKFGLAGTDDGDA